MVEAIFKEEAVKYTDELPDKAGQRKLTAKCPFCGEISKAFVSDHAITFIGGCGHFDDTQANIVQAIFKEKREG